ncbi:MAG: aminoacyl-tRNA hydrolase [Oscillospiraceae bacterium]|jgi:PTH1 family peptidyl-tRNA hydrolase|nr:aminoacyl-tRNA hydrolase [Oscillospiraceae bacterium]
MRKFPFLRFSDRRSGGAGVGWLVVFLGNPGERYAKTRHNAGFMAARVVEERTGARIDRLKFHALTAVTELGGERVLLLKPQTFMNLSGDAAREAMRFYKLAADRLIVVSDDAALRLGALRVRPSGSAGGHNGLRDIIDKCGGDGFARVRIGVGAPPETGRDMMDWVLSRFEESDMPELGDALERAASAVEAIISRGAEKAMNDFNRN